MLEMVLLHSKILNVKHFPGFFKKTCLMFSKTRLLNGTLPQCFFSNSPDMTQLTLIRHADDGSCVLLTGRFLSHAAFLNCINCGAQLHNILQLWLDVVGTSLASGIWHLSSRHKRAKGPAPKMAKVHSCALYFPS